MLVLARAASPWDLVAAWEQMALSLGWHIVLACLGIGLPALTAFAEWRGERTREAAFIPLAPPGGNAMGVVFAAGAGSGATLSVQMGLLWPGPLGTDGPVV